MLECSLGKITSAIVRRALSGFTFTELNIPMASYSDSPKFELAIDDLKLKFKTAGADVHMQEDGRAVLKITGILESQTGWMDTKPMSVETADTSELLGSMKIANGPRVSTTFLNLFLTQGQLAIVLANMSPKTAFVDFEKNLVVYYSELYKKKPLQVHGIFSRMYCRAPIAGFIGWENYNTGYYPKDTQNVLPFGQFTNVDQTTLENVLKNCNEISKMFTDMQSFTANHLISLGDTVVSNLTYDKKIVVASEEHYDVNSQVTAVYYCI